MFKATCARLKFDEWDMKKERALTENTTTVGNLDFSPFFFRVRTETFGGAWCPKGSISEGVREWIQIDLGAEYRIRRTGTQGRFGGGRGQEYVEKFFLEYWRERIGKWTKYTNQSGHEVGMHHFYFCYFFQPLLDSIQSYL